jgi:hypothetical protein
LLTGVLDRSALYGVLTEIEALGLDLLELRQLAPQRKSAESGDRRPGPGARREPGADGIQPGVGAVGANARLNPKAAAAARGSKISRLGKPR